MHDKFIRLTSLGVTVTLALLLGCGNVDEGSGTDGSRIRFEIAATVQDPELAEISGIEIAEGPVFLVHNDDGAPLLFALDLGGEVVGRFELEGAKNHDWEDLARMPLDGRRVMVVGDIGDNEARRTSIQLYFAELPENLHTSPEQQAVRVVPTHVLELRYPDGPRDCEALAYDPVSGMILLLTKRDKPARLYGVDSARAMEASDLELEFLGTVHPLRPPSRDDYRKLGKAADWISQPTGMDINEDGTLAAVITYRSLYLFSRSPQQSWAEAFLAAPREFLGPISSDEEAVAFSESDEAVYITTEKHPAPIYRAVLPKNP